MAVAYVQAAVTENSTSTTHTFNMPTGVTNGNVLILLLAWYGGADNDLGALTGWTAVDDNVGSPFFDEELYRVYWREASSEPATYTVPTLTSTSVVTAIVAEFSGADTATPIHVSDFTDEGSHTSSVSPSVTTTIDGCMIIATERVSSWGTTTEDANYPSTMTGIYRRNNAAAADNNANIGMAYLAQATQGTTATFAWTAYGGARLTHLSTFAIAPSTASSETIEVGLYGRYV